jgi:hypothetical protein
MAPNGPLASSHKLQRSANVTAPDLAEALDRRAAAVKHRRSMGGTSVGSLVVISGSIGSGKTTVARALVEASPPPLAYIEGDDFWRFLAKPRAGGPRRNIRAIMPAMLRAAAAIAADDYEAILDFSMPPAFARAASARVTGVPVHYLELRPALAVCSARAAGRAEGVIADYAPYTDFYDAFDAEDRFVIRNDAIGPAAVAAEIRAGMADGRFLFR